MDTSFSIKKLLPPQLLKTKGMGSYKKKERDGRVWYEWVRTVDGKPQYETGKTPGILKEKVDKKAGIAVAKSKLKVSALYTKWFSNNIEFPLKSKATNEQYRIMYEQHIADKIGHRKVSNVTETDIEDIFITMRKKGCGTSAMKHTKTVLNVMFTYAKKKLKAITESPVKEIEISNVQEKEQKVLSVRDFEKLLGAMENSRWIWSIRFLLVTGMRRGEMLSLKWTDIDFDNRRMTLQRSNSSGGEGNTKSKKVFNLPVSLKALEYLEEQKNQLEKEKNPILYNKELSKTMLIFPSINGTLLRGNSYYTMLRRFAEDAGIKAHPHALRHTFVFLSKDKLSLEELQKFVCHDRKTITDEIYGNIIRENTVQSADKLDEVFNQFDEQVEKIKLQKAKASNQNNVIEFKKKAK